MEIRTLPYSAEPLTPSGFSLKESRLAQRLQGQLNWRTDLAGILPFWANAREMEGSTVFDSEFERSLFDLRKAKLEEIVKLGQAAYPNQFPADRITVPEVRAQWGEAPAEALEANRVTVAVAGRIMAIRAAGQGRLRHPATRRPAAADLRPPGRRGRAGLCAL